MKTALKGDHRFSSVFVSQNNFTKECKHMILDELHILNIIYNCCSVAFALGPQYVKDMKYVGSTFYQK